MKKKVELLIILLCGVAVLGLVSAGLLQYYGKVIATINSEQPISVRYGYLVVTGQTISENIVCVSGETCKGEKVEIWNDGLEPRDIMFEYSNQEGIDVGFEVVIWEPLEGGGFTGTHEILEGNTITILPESYASMWVLYTLDGLLKGGEHNVEITILPA